MKKLLFLLICLFAYSAYGQISTNIRYYGARTTAQEPATCSTAVGGIYYNKTEKRYYQCTDTNTWSPMAGGGASIGGEVTDGTSGSIPFVDGDGKLAQDNANFFYNDSTKQVKLAQGTNAGIVFGTSSATHDGRIWRGNTGGMNIGVLDNRDFSITNQSGTAVFSVSYTGGVTADSVAVTDDAYDATSWNGSTAVPTKNAIRDKIESLSGGATSPLELEANSASEVPLTLKGAASQTGNLTDWKSNTPTTLLSVTKDGYLQGSTSDQQLRLLDTGFQLQYNSNSYLSMGTTTSYWGTQGLRLRWNGTSFAPIDYTSYAVGLGAPDGRWSQLYLDATITPSGTTGAQTINKGAFSVNFAAAATSLVVTNSLVTASTKFLCTVQTNDTTMFAVKAVAASGSVTLYANAAATAETEVYCEVRN